MFTKKTIKKHWTELEKLHVTSEYIYPGKLDDATVETQDSGKHLREAKFLQKYLPKKCGEILLDYGCGEGKMFKYIKEHYKNYPSLVVGIDPDKNRLVRAKKMLKTDGGKGVFLNTTLEDKTFCHKNLKNSLFCILCIQILGHISSNSLEKVIKGFKYLLEPKGTLIIAMPVVNNYRNDFFGLVNLSLNPKDSKFRILLTKRNFNHITNHPQENLLPVRSFSIKEKIEIGHICNRKEIEDTSLGKTLRKYKFIIKSGEIYSRHDEGIGDLIIKAIS